MDTDSNRKFSGIKEWFLLILGTLLFAFLAASYYQKLDGPRPIIRFEYRSSADVLTRWDFDRGDGWETDDRVRWTLVASRDFISEEIMLPQWPAKKMKVNFDPIHGEIEFRNLHIYHAKDVSENATILAETMKPVADTTAFQEKENGFLIKMVGEKVPSVGWPMKHHKAAWDFSLFQSPFLTRFLRASIFFMLCSGAIWGPIYLQGREAKQ